MIDTGVEVEGAGGLARPLRKDERQKQHDVLAEHLARAHVVICAASIPGRRAPRIITEDMVDGMLPESVIVDLAASTGGNCELTHIGEHHYHNETLIVGPLNLPSHGAVHASEMYARNVHNMLQLIIREHEVVLNPDDDIIARCVVCHDGQINHEPTAVQLEIDYVPFGGAVHVAAEFPDQGAGWLEAHADDPDDTVTEYKEPESDDSPAQLSHNTGDSPATSADTPSDTSGRVDAAQTAANDQPLHESGLSKDQESQAEPHRVDSLRFTTEDSAEGDDEAPGDDLTQIEGVGPVMQEWLYAFGFRRFEDIAILDDDGVQKLAVQLSLEDEVEEQDWRGQARRLMKGEGS